MNVKSASRLAPFTLAALMIGASTTLIAHTKLAKSEPAAGATLTTPPTQIQLWFNESVDPSVSKIELKSGSGPVALAPAQATGGKSLTAGIKGAVGSGTYTVGWQTAGDDGHVVKGEFSFTVKTSR